MHVALDTNRYRDLVDGDEELRDLLERADTITLPFVVVAELRAGFAHGTRGRDNERRLRELLDMDDVRVVYADEATTHVYAQVYRQLRMAGTPIPTHDIWIAALVLQHGLSLCSRDKHFDRIGQLPRV